MSLWLLCGGDIVKELKEYNDYVMITKQYLRQYNQLRFTAESKRIQAKDIREELAGSSDIAAPIAKYGNQTGGGSPELNAVEAAANRRVKNAEKADLCEEEAKRIEHLLEVVDHALASLDDRDQALLRGHYLEKRPGSSLQWIYICQRIGRANQEHVLCVPWRQSSSASIPCLSS